MADEDEPSFPPIPLVPPSNMSSVSVAAQVVSSPMDKFLSVRRRRCALAGGGAWRAGWGSRRQANVNLKPASSPHLSPEQNLDLYAPDYKVGPEKGPHYDPNYGYEPYWADGMWVHKNSSGQDPQPDEYCGNLCSPLYKNYGHICAINKQQKYNTFDNYCKMAGDDCNSENGWKIVYRGPCIATGEQAQGNPNAISLKHTLAKKQPGIKKKIIQDFYNKFNLPPGGSLFNGSTRKWEYTAHYTDFKRR